MVNQSEAAASFQPEEMFPVRPQEKHTPGRKPALIIGHVRHDYSRALSKTEAFLPAST